MHLNESVKAFDRGEFHILHKGPSRILAMPIVYDNDYQAADLVGPGWARWVGRDNIRLDAGGRGPLARLPFGGVGRRSGSLAQLSAHSSRRRRFRGQRLREQAIAAALITDFMGYNSWEGERLTAIRPNRIGWAI